MLEKHTKLGGTTHEFLEQGIEFDTGLHYVGAEVFKPTSVARKIFDWITDDGLKWERLDDVYDMAVVKGEKFPMKTGISWQKADLTKRFPEFKEQIQLLSK